MIDPRYPFVLSQDRGFDAWSADDALPFLNRRTTDIRRGTDGLADIRISRFDRDYEPRVRIEKRNQSVLTIRYLLKGRMRLAVAGHGEHTLRPGSAWIESTGVTDAVMHATSGTEFIEVVLPGDFADVDVVGDATDTTCGPRKLDERLPDSLASMRNHFSVCHLNGPQDFTPGRRLNSLARDLGVAAATRNAVVARMGQRFAPVPAVPERKHLHNTQLQLVYLVRGWLRSEVEGQGEVFFPPDSCWTQPPHIEHAMRSYSPESFELFEVIIPATFGTIEIADPIADAIERRTGVRA